MSDLVIPLTAVDLSSPAASVIVDVRSAALRFGVVEREFVVNLALIDTSAETS